MATLSCMMTYSSKKYVLSFQIRDGLGIFILFLKHWKNLNIIFVTLKKEIDRIPRNLHYKSNINTTLNWFKQHEI